MSHGVDDGNLHTSVNAYVDKSLSDRNMWEQEEQCVKDRLESGRSAGRVPEGMEACGSTQPKSSRGEPNRSVSGEKRFGIFSHACVR